MKISNRFKKTELNLLLTLLAAVLLAGCITLLALWCQPNSMRSMLIYLKAQPLLIVLNALPVGLLLLALTCLLKNVFTAAGIVNLLVCGLSIANRVKIEVRDEPLFPRDLALMKEVGSIVGSYDLQFPLVSIAVVVLASLALILLGTVIRSKPFPVKKLQGWLGRLLGAAASTLVLTGLIFTVYASNDLYNSFQVTNAYYVPSVFNELGFPYCFCHHFTTYPIGKPADFDRGAAETWETSGETVSGQPINVIMVMNESFSDLSDGAMFAYDESSDPLPNFHALQQDPNAVVGHIVVPGFAGGTANTEFDVLTGIQTNALSATTTSALRVVNRNLDSLFRVFGDQGYHTSYFHPGDDWFYNRENVYRWFGAEETRFVDEMTDPEMKGRWVTDEYAAGLIEAEFEQAVEDGQTLFHYTTTIQNHMSYTADKYGENYNYPEVPLTIPVSEQVETMLEVYIEGVRDADAMLGRLQDYFARQDEPVVLVYFGDHMPYLGDNQLAYQELGLTTQTYWSELTSYQTPYVIWTNDAAAALVDWSAAEELPEQMSASFLGAAVLEMTGAKTPWFSFLNDLRREAPVIQKQTAVLADGSILVEDGITAGNSTGAGIPDTVQKWRQWSYYKLKYQEFAP